MGGGGCTTGKNYYATRTFLAGLGNRSFWKRANRSFLLKRAKKERKSDSLFLRSFALFERGKRAIRSFALFLKRVKERFTLWRSF